MQVGDMVHYKRMADNGDFTMPFIIKEVVHSPINPEPSYRLTGLDKPLTDGYKLHFFESLFLDTGQYQRTKRKDKLERILYGGTNNKK